MRRRLTGIAVAFLLTVAVALGYREYRSPENSALDDAARAGAGGEYVALDDGVTHYELRGPASGRQVVLVHGFSVPYYIWDSTAVRLTDAGYRVLRYDLFGRGTSDRPRADYDGAFYDAQLEGLLDSLRIEGPVDLIGLSFGGFVTAHFVATHTDRVRTLTLIDPSTGGGGLPARFGLPVIGPWLWQVQRVPGMAEGQASDFLHPENHPDWVERYRPQMRFRGFGRALLSTIRAGAAVNFDTLYANVAKTGVPVLLIWGRQDRTVPFRQSEVVRRNIPSVEFLPVDSAGHLPHMEQAATVHERLIRFLKSRADRRP